MDWYFKRDNFFRFDRAKTEIDFDEFACDSKLILIWSVINWLVGISLPLAYWNQVSCYDSYPWETHIIFAWWCFFWKSGENAYLLNTDWLLVSYCAIVVMLEIGVAFYTTKNFTKRCKFNKCCCGECSLWWLRMLFDVTIGMLARGNF